MQTLDVDLGARSYPIYIGEGLLDDVTLIRQHITGHQVLVVTNETVAPLYLQQLQQSLSGLQYSQVILPDGEQHKSLAVLSTIYDQLLIDKHNRSTTLIALGGGVVGDMAGFAAASYQRGVNFIQVPTTLLAQVDSSVGGKTAVNHPLGKNMIGAFHQPQCVIADTSTLAALPQRELAAGIAEVVKYGLICDEPFYHWLTENVELLLARDHQALAEAIYRSCLNKANIVAKDETESGVRAILNLGHTFGHAIETAQGYGSWLHGEAVAAGMVLAAKLSERLGWLSSHDINQLEALLKTAGLPIAPPAIDTEQFLSLMMVDKKVLDGRLRLVLLKRIGKALITSDVAETDVRATLEAANNES